MYEGAPENKRERISKICSDFGVEIVDNCADVTNLSLEEAMSLFQSLIDTDEMVLHGTNSSEVYKCLEARQGHCTIKESGRKVAVYASTGSKTALSIAVLNRKYLSNKFGGYSSAFSGNDDRLIFRFPPEIFALFQSHDQNLFADGYVYVLDKANFVNASDAGSEWHAESDQEPLTAFRVSKELGQDLYIITGTKGDTVFEGKFDK